ncbi:hypothetical protein [Vampirovibrio chlorellavorus]|uniref:hypothetical protein n=1 Tax=Vampirovibrio chlorellavorus TaxID=758823 RepID=UPI0026EF4F78|nr:hypothetical protein [Vampirovibrio chlorellavorus]
MTAYKQLSLREKATLFTDLIREPGWDLLQNSFRPELRTRVTDTDAKEAFLYEAIRAQVIQEIFSTPLLIIQQADREWSRKPMDTD